jgi:hypothetical protein
MPSEVCYKIEDLIIEEEFAKHNIQLPIRINSFKMIDPEFFSEGVFEEQLKLYLKPHMVKEYIMFVFEEKKFTFKPEYFIDFKYEVIKENGLSIKASILLDFKSIENDPNLNYSMVDFYSTVYQLLQISLLEIISLRLVKLGLFKKLDNFEAVKVPSNIISINTIYVFKVEWSPYVEFLIN